MPERPSNFSKEPGVISEVEKTLLPWNDLFLAVVARSRLGGFDPGSKYFQGIASIPEENKKVGVRVNPTYVLKDSLPRIVLVNLYDVLDESEQHVQAFLANSTWEKQTPIVQRVEELPVIPNSGIRVGPEDAGKIALEVTLNLNPASKLPIFEPPTTLQ